MRYLTTDDLRLAVADLLDAKAALLASSKAFALYKPALTTNRAALEALYVALSGRPLAEELAAVDAEHDTTGRAFHCLAEGLAPLDGISGEKRALLEKARAAFAPSLVSFNAGYADEAAAAGAKRAALDGMRTELAAWTVAPDLTLASLAERHVAAAERLGALLSRRADAVAEDQAAKERRSLTVRAETVGLLGRLRRALADEISLDAALPRDLELKAFAYVDQLAASREERATKPAKNVTAPATGSAT
jgi:hypothetical protein